MKNSIRFFVGCSLLLLIVCYSCGVPSSEKEKNAAQQAMDNAKSLHAEDFAAANWMDAMLAWDQGEAAVQEGKPARAFFIRAKSRFEKAAAIAKSQGAVWSREVSDIQLAIAERFSKIKAALEKGRMPSKIQKQINAVVADVEKAKESLDSLVAKGELVKAKALAKETQTKLYNAELIMAGKKPVS